MRTSVKLMTVFALTLSAPGFYTPAALAAAPTNDTFANATAVTVGFSEVLDTTLATTDADDAQLNTSCGAPATDASVWYRIDGSDTDVVVDVSSSNYSAGVLVGVGSQGNLQLVTCGQGSVSFFAAAGTTYYVLAIDDQLDGSGNGGSLSISFNGITPPPTVSITVNPTGKVNIHTGVATISGTYTCTDGDFIGIVVDARQRVGRFTILGSGEFLDFNTCDGAAHGWSANVVPQKGTSFSPPGRRFAGGKAMTVSFATSCGPFECSFGYVEQKVQLSGGK